MRRLSIMFLILLLPTAALAQSRTYYDGSGRVVGRSSTSLGGGSTTYYDASGRVKARDAHSGNTTTTYDASGRVVGRTTRRQ